MWSFFKRLTWGNRFTNCNLPKYILFFEMVFSFGEELVEQKWTHASQILAVKVQQWEQLLVGQ